MTRPEIGISGPIQTVLIPDKPLVISTKGHNIPPTLAITELTPSPKFRILVGNSSNEIRYENEYAPEMKNLPTKEMVLLQESGKIRTRRQAHPPSTIRPLYSGYSSCGIIKDHVELNPRRNIHIFDD